MQTVKAVTCGLFTFPTHPNGRLRLGLDIKISYGLSDEMAREQRLSLYVKISYLNPKPTSLNLSLYKCMNNDFWQTRFMSLFCQE